MSELRTRILALDIASNCGWSCMDTTLPPSAIINGSFDLRTGIPKKIKGRKPMTGVEKRNIMIRNMIPILGQLCDIHKPIVICLEQPLNNIGNDEDDPTQPGQKRKTGPNASTVLALNQLFGAAKGFFLGRGAYVMEVAPRTWQTLTRRYPGADTKARSIAFCGALKIPVNGKTIIQRGDAADASCIAIFAEGECRARKMRMAQKELL